MSTALLLLPDFSLILLGLVLRRALALGDHFWSGVEKLVYFVLFPALLFNGLVRTRIDWQAAGPLIATAALAMLGALTLASGLRVFRLAPRQYASLHQCAFRFNSYIGLAIAGSLHGAAGVAAMAIVVGVMVPPANMAAVWVLARHGEHALWRELLKNPLIVATLAGLMANLAGVSLPDPALRLLGRLGDAAVALGLLAVGAGLRLNALRQTQPPHKEHSSVTAEGITPAHNQQRAASAYLLLVKLVAMPLAAWLLARALQLPPLYADIALIFAALPTASSAFILAQRMGGDGAIVAWQISASTLLAMITIPLWLGLT